MVAGSHCYDPFPVNLAESREQYGTSQALRIDTCPFYPKPGRGDLDDSLFLIELNPGGFRGTVEIKTRGRRRAVTIVATSCKDYGNYRSVDPYVSEIERLTWACQMCDYIVHLKSS